MRYQSNALWPEHVYRGERGDCVSTDAHDTEDAARAVCRALEREGFGGERKHFPIRTWVSGPKEN